MKKHQCPHCQQDTVSFKQKYLAGLWQVVNCQQCNKRSCANPIILALIYMAYAWTLAWFVFGYALEGIIDSLYYLIPIWIGLDLLNINLIPLSRMKSKPQ